MYTKGHYQESEEATHGMGENTCKSYVSDKALIPGILKKTPTTQQPKNKQPDLKMGKEIE